MRLRRIHLTRGERLRHLSHYETQNTGSIPSQRFERLNVDVNATRVDGARSDLPPIWRRNDESQDPARNRSSRRRGDSDGWSSRRLQRRPRTAR